MTGHQFRVGDLVRVWVSVSVRPGEGVVDATAKDHISGIYEVIHLLPASPNGEPRYRIRGCSGQGECVVQKSQLASAIHFPQSRR
jgi:hypothetical protein